MPGYSARAAESSPRRCRRRSEAHRWEHRRRCPRSRSATEGVPAKPSAPKDEVPGRMQPLRRTGAHKKRGLPFRHFAFSHAPNRLRPGTERLNSNVLGRTYSRETCFVNGVALCHGNGRFDLFHENAQLPQNRAFTLLETRHDRAEVGTAPPAIHRCARGKCRPVCGHQNAALHRRRLRWGSLMRGWIAAARAASKPRQRPVRCNSLATPPSLP